MDTGFKIFASIAAVIALIWYTGASQISSAQTPTKPTTGFEHFDSACILYIQAMPVCGSASTMTLPSYLSPNCTTFIQKNIIKAPGCKSL
jgi:hypothetical protein